MLILLDLWTALPCSSAYADRDFWKKPPLVAGLENVVGQGKIYRSKDPYPRRITSETNRVEELHRQNLSLLRDYSAWTYGFRVVFHLDYHDLAPKAVVDLNDLVEILPWERKREVLKAAGVSAVLTKEETGLNPAMTVEEEGETYRIISLPSRNVSLFLPHQSSPIEDRDVVPFVLSRFDADQHLFIHADDQTRLLSGRFADAAVRRKSHDNHDELHFTVVAPKAGLLYIPDTMYRGWKSSVDGEDVEILRANFAFRAVPVPGGTHEVYLRYLPSSLLFGSAISFLTIIMAFGWLVMDRRS